MCSWRAWLLTRRHKSTVRLHHRGVGLLLAVAVAVPVLLVLVPVALAGKYTVLSCPGDAGWSQDPPNAQFITFDDGCAGTAMSGLSLALGPNPDSGYATNSDGAITFSVPGGFSISSYTMRLLADGGPCSIASNQCATGFGDVWVNHTGQADPNYDYRNLGYASQSVEIAPSALSGANWVTVGVGCDGGPGGYDCAGSQGSSPEAFADIQSADFVIDNEATPTASGFGGTLLDPDAHGTADLQFTAADPGGPGVYLVTVQIDGNDVYNSTPNGNEGSCAMAGTYTNGSWEFEALQPCKQSETVDVPVNTTALSDGQPGGANSENVADGIGWFLTQERLQHGVQRTGPPQHGCSQPVRGRSVPASCGGKASSASSRGRAAQIPRSTGRKPISRVGSGISAGAAAGRCRGTRTRPARIATGS